MKIPDHLASHDCPHHDPGDAAPTRAVGSMFSAISRSYEIIGDVLSAHKQIGNAVPSALAELLGREIRRQLFEDPTVPLDQPLTLVPQRARRVPREELVEDVTDLTLLAMVRDYSDHPGPGKGPGAASRGHLPSSALADR